MQKSVMRVRGSAGLKFPSEFSVKGSARIETDSSATARVELDDTVNNEGEMPGAANAAAAQKVSKPAQKIETKHLRTAKARIFIGSFL
jgi:hypothetical protein